MKKFMLIGLVAMVLALMVGLAGPALADTVGYLDTPTLNRVAQALGISPAELTSSLQAGKTLAQLATDRKVAPEKVVGAIIGPYPEELQLRVKYGYLTQQQADSQLAQAQENARTLLERNLSTSTSTGDSDYSWEDMQQDCNQMMGSVSGGQGNWGGMMGSYGNGMMQGWNGSQGGWGGMMGGSGNGMMQGWNTVPTSPRTSTSDSSWGGTFGRTVSQGWNGMMGGLRGFANGLGGMTGGWGGSGGGMMGGWGGSGGNWGGSGGGWGGSTGGGWGGSGGGMMGGGGGMMGSW